MKKDALGNPIVIGEKYGYSQNEHGFTRVRVGEAVRETSQKVTLKVIEAKRAVYHDDLKKEPMTKDHISVKSNMLFPVLDDVSIHKTPVEIFEEENKRFFEEMREWEENNKYENEYGEMEPIPFPKNKGYNFSASYLAIERAMKRYVRLKIEEYKRQNNL